MSICFPTGFLNLKTLRLAHLDVIVIDSAFARLVARLEELEVTNLTVLIPEVPPLPWSPPLHADEFDD